MRLVAVLMCALLVGCGTNQPQSDLPDTTLALDADTVASTEVTTTIKETTTSAASTTNTPDPLALASAAMVVMSDGFEISRNDLYEAYTDDQFSGITWDKFPAYCTEYAIMVDTLAADVAGYIWPAEVQRTADALVAALIAHADSLRVSAALPGDAAAQDANFDEYSLTSEVLEAALGNHRAALGLPRVYYHEG